MFKKTKVITGSQHCKENFFVGVTIKVILVMKYLFSICRIVVLGNSLEKAIYCIPTSLYGESSEKSLTSWVQIKKENLYSVC